MAQRYIILILMVITHLLLAQNSQKLRDFLWKTEFNSLLQRFAEETVELVDEGERSARIRARPYSIAEGWRVQVFAGTNREYARSLALRLRHLQLDSVYVVQSDQLFKVQMGNFTQRSEAEKLLNRLWHADIDNAWIVKTEIHIPKSRPTSVPKEKAELEGKLVYSIQIFVTRHAQRADSIRRQVQNKFGLEARTINTANGWKVLLGEFNHEESARQILKLVKQNGFPDAWITQVARNTP